MSKAAQKKEEQRIEKIIRNLLKLPENRRCINCTSLGPQYVCTTFWTFVCTNCSGLHREFTHRVKSVSMAKFTADEVIALQMGGNERAREIYFKSWDPQRNFFPDGSNQNRMRDFIRHVYVDRKYTAKSAVKLDMVKADTKEDVLGRRSLDSPSYGGKIRVSGANSNIDERRSPRYKTENVKSSSGHRNRTARFEIVDDRFRDDDFGRGRRSEIRRPYNRGSSAEGRPTVANQGREKLCPPEVRPIKDILGEDVPPLQLGKSLEGNNDGEDKTTTGAPEKSKSLSDLSAADAKSPEHRKEKSVSLIDLTEPPGPALAPQSQETTTSTVKHFDAPPVNPLELMLFELSTPESGTELSGDTDTFSAGPDRPVIGESDGKSPVGMELTLLSGGGDGSHLTASGDITPSTHEIIYPAGASSDQAWGLSPTPNAQSSSNASVTEPCQPGSNEAQHLTSESGTEAHTVEAKSGGRGELPADLFTASYPSYYPTPVQGWQFHPPHGMGYNMQYLPTPVVGPAFTNTARSMNPFDINNEITQVQSPMSQVPPYQDLSPAQLPTYGMSPVPGAFSGQQLPYSVPLPGSQGDDGACKEQDSFASLSPIQQHNLGNPAPSTTNSSPPSGGNPFG